MDRLARHIAVDQRLREAFRQVGGCLEGAEPGGEGDRARPFGAQRHPDVPPPDLVAGALYQQPAGRQPCAQPPPHGGHLVLVVLAQHIRRPDEDRCPLALPRQRHLEAAVEEVQPRPFVRPGGLDPRRIYLYADDPGVRAYRTQPAQQLHRGPGRGAVAEVDRHGVGGAAQLGAVFGRYPAVHAAQPVGVGGPAGGGADGPGRRGYQGGGGDRGAADHAIEGMGWTREARPPRSPAAVARLGTRATLGHALAKYGRSVPDGNGWPGCVVAGGRRRAARLA